MNTGVKRTFPVLFTVLFTVMLGLDQWSKAWARAQADGVEGYVFWPIWPNVFELKLAYNYGIAFGLFQGAGQLFAPVAVIIFGVAAWYALRTPADQRATHVALGLLAAGAIGNLIDRVWLGKVTDMFWIRAINFPVFNIADTCITFAAVLLGVLSIRAEAAASPAKVASPVQQPAPVGSVHEEDRPGSA